MLKREIRKIIHIDMDCFFAAVETKYCPEYRGKPLAIGGPAHTRSVIATANYEARRYKVKSAMPSSQALRLCPHLILVPPQFELYKKESRAVREIFSRFTDKIEPLSLDEAYLDVTHSPLFGGSATLMAQEIRRLIFTERQLTASAGIAPNKFLAKVASDWKKPNGQFVIRPEDVDSFVKDLPIEKIYGVGKVTAQRLHQQGIHICSDLQRQAPWQMKRLFGVRGLELLSLAFGKDDRPVESCSLRKSLTVEETYNKDLVEFSEWQNKIPDLYEDWSQRIRRAKLENAIGGLVVKVKFFDFSHTTHEVKFKHWPHVSDYIKMFERIWKKNEKPCRLLGLGVRLATEVRLDHNSEKQLNLF